MVENVLDENIFFFPYDIEKYSQERLYSSYKICTFISVELLNLIHRLRIIVKFYRFHNGKIFISLIIFNHVVSDEYFKGKDIFYAE